MNDQNNLKTTNTLEDRLPESLIFALGVTALFFLLGLIGILRHEMWRDELQARSIARDSITLPDLFRNLRYEGHPGLWHLFLFVISRFTGNPRAMQIFHLLVATGTAFILLRYSPFTRIQKILLIFGYLMFFEYTLISRNYGLGVLLLFSFCAVFPFRRKSYLPHALILFLLAQTCAYGIMISFWLMIFIVLDYQHQPQLRQGYRQRKWEPVLSLGIICIGLLLATVQIIPPADRMPVNIRTAIDVKHLAASLATVWRAYIAIPEFKLHFWGTNILENYDLFRLLLSLFFLLISALLLLKKRLVFLFYSASTFSLILFFYSVYFGSIRHHGYLFIIFVASLWLADQYPDKKTQASLLSRLSVHAAKVRTSFLLLIFTAQFAGGIFAVAMDWMYPFSASKETAKYLKQSSLSKKLIIAHEDLPASAVAAYLNKKFYYPRSDRFGTFIIWDRKRTRKTWPVMMKKIFEFGKAQESEPVLLLTWYFDISGYPLVKVKEFKAGIVADEYYNIFRFKKPGEK